ncbi:ribitol-5-phosphate xylosyltransferase 1-like [Daphnia carinata]|uniref:ribitol-5-phosphate xylosyltransferase 1-like n=1 Tax=Daphnia carinata TaxID=120202 RepID=UPI00257ABA61|nr:ribitol-5-phosphate xylosyltransferase 1-like [Daphnia carinata]
MIVYVKRRVLKARSCQILGLLILLACAVLFLLHSLCNNEISFQYTFQKRTGIKTSITNDITTMTSEFLRVDIHSRTPIGEYLWNHLLEGKKELMSDKATYKGNKMVDDLNFTYQTGNAEISITSASNIVLVIDGSSQLNQKKEELWLNNMLLFRPPKSLFLVILGDNACDDNQWIVHYLSSNGGPISAAFMVRSSFLADEDEVYQWPLGVTTNRDFPLFWANEIDILSPRPFICNYFGTNPAHNATQDVIPQLLKALKLENSCYLKMSSKTAFSTIEPVGEYIQAVSDSDLSLCPATETGSPETHCIYEAFSLGSVPVVEDVEVSCGRDSLFLLKKHKAPFLLVESLENELGDVIAKENTMNLQEKIARRATVINWYADFRHYMAKQFYRVVFSKINL